MRTQRTRARQPGAASELGSSARWVADRLDRFAVGEGAAGMKMGEKSLNPRKFQNRDEELVALAHRAGLALQPREC